MHEGRVDVDLPLVWVDGDDLHELYDDWRPPGAIHARVNAHGPRAAVQTKIAVRLTRKGAVDFDGTIDLDRRAVKAAIDHQLLDGAYFPAAPPFVISARVQLSGRLANGQFRGPYQLTGGEGLVSNVLFHNATANGAFVENGVEFGRVALDLPGGTATGRAHVTYQGKVDAELRMHVSEVLKLASLARGNVESPAPPKDRSLATVDARLTKEPKQPPHFHIKGIGLAKPIPRRPDATPK